CTNKLFSKSAFVQRMILPSDISSALQQENLMTAKLSPTDLRSSEIVSINPATLDEIARFPISSNNDVNAAVARARAAQPAWAALSYRNRARYVLKARRALYDRQNEIIRILSDETGKPNFEALTTEVFPTCDLM